MEASRKLSVCINTIKNIGDRKVVFKIEDRLTKNEKQKGYKPISERVNNKPTNEYHNPKDNDQEYAIEVARRELLLNHDNNDEVIKTGYAFYHINLFYQESSEDIQDEIVYDLKKGMSYDDILTKINNDEYK